MNPSQKHKERMKNIELFLDYHRRYPTHGYRWLNAKIRLDLGLIFSDNYAHTICKYVGIRSVSKRFRKYKTTDKWKIYPNLLLADLSITRPLKVIVSDMTTITIDDTYYEITLYMDLFNNEIVAYDISTKRGDRETYFNGLEELIKKKEACKDLESILHTDQGSVYASKSFNNLAQLNNITHSMSRAGTPTDNGAMEAINGWLKEELFNDFHLSNSDDIIKSIEDYIVFFNEQRPAYALNYLTPKQFKEKYC